jgi:hypothetical protein
MTSLILELLRNRGVALSMGDAEVNIGGGALYDAGQVADDGLAGSRVGGGADARGNILIVRDLHNDGEDDVQEEVEV